MSEQNKGTKGPDRVLGILQRAEDLKVTAFLSLRRRDYAELERVTAEINKLTLELEAIRLEFEGTGSTEANTGGKFETED